LRVTRQAPRKTRKASISSELPSVDETTPDDEGGTNARRGFDFQDEVAVSFFIGMLEDSSILKVHCETHDDIVLVCSGARNTRIAEYVQVKGGEPDTLWSVADLCHRPQGKAGTSILERSLLRDKCKESSRFRLVTLRPVVSALRYLTHPFSSVGRKTDTDVMAALLGAIGGRVPGLTSTKGNGLAYWIANCLWENGRDKAAIEESNLVRLLRVAQSESKLLLPESADTLLDEMRTRAKKAAAHRWETDREKKIVSRQQVLEWWKSRTAELTEGWSTPSGGKLAKKMKAATLPEDMIALAVEMRRAYSAEFRSPRYLESAEAEQLRDRVRSEVASLRSQQVSGEIDLDGPAFHSACLKRMDAISAERIPRTEDRSAFLKGCMYDIADRCMLQFVTPQ
jgi:hypothetical protein